MSMLSIIERVKWFVKTTKKSNQVMHMKGATYPMIYYRIALQSEHSSFWQWRSSTLTSASAVFDMLKAYTYVPKAAVRVFCSSSSVYMDEMLARANDGLVASFVTVEQFLREGPMSSIEIRRLELEMGPGGDHDSPYMFALPANMVQVRAWTKLLARVRNGELNP
jgi:hypothetical protein